MTEKEVEVRKRLIVVVVLVEVVSLALLLLFLRLKIVPDAKETALLMMLPIVFGLHVTEEFIAPGGFISWNNLFRPQFARTSASYYVKLNGYVLVLSLLVVLGAFDYRGGFGFGISSWLVVATFMSWNAIYHLRGAIKTRSYSPGMVTGLGLFWPLTVISCAHFMETGVMRPWMFVECTVVALLIQPALDAMKRHGQKKSA
ncbi:MAG TPA: HXXEE domain-containing protein [Terracidiphilus sp.]|nr:HXXEE domain-containing protein [Terracidiphilus sp.]